MGVADVRDVAFAHLQATKVPEAANRRFIIAKDTVKWADLAKPIQEKFVPQAGLSVK